MFLASIVQRTDVSWHVERRMVEFYANNPFKLRKLAGTWTYKIDGKRVGFKVRPTECSILFDAGFESNDVVTSINGVRVSTLLEALAAYFNLRGSSTFTVEILRNGEKITQVYTTDKTKKEIRREQREDRRQRRQNRRNSRRDAVALD